MVRIIPPAPAGKHGAVPGHGTRVEMGGCEVAYVAGVTIRIAPDDVIRAELTMCVAIDEVWALPVLSEESMIAAADYWGYEVRKRDEN